MKTINLLHRHWLIIAYETEKNGQFLKAVEVEVSNAETETEALEKAKQMIIRPLYVVRKVWECTRCFYAEGQQNILKKMVKALHE